MVVQLHKQEMFVHGGGGAGGRSSKYVLGVLVGFGEGAGELHELVESHRTIGAGM
jgi:hypothetical protein